MGSEVVVRKPDLKDVAALARAHVESWQETYRGLMPDAILDGPDFLERRERFWTSVLDDDQCREKAVAEREGEVVGIALAGPPTDEDATWTMQLYVLYTYAAVHGSGAGSALLLAVLDPKTSAGLWVADPNPRAQAFCRKHGFVADGTSKIDDGVREIRMVRSSRTPNLACPQRLG